MTAYHFVVPGPPIPKGRPRFGSGHTYTPKRTEDHERKIAVYALNSKVKCSAKPLIVECWFFLDTHRRVDVDNLGKAVCDGLNRVAWKDDAQIIDLSLYKRYDKEYPRTMITITEVAL